MPRSLALPEYTSATLLNGASKRTLTPTAPSTTDSVATTGPAATLLQGRNYYLLPEGAAAAGTLNAVGTASGQGWGLVPSAVGAVPLASDGFTLAAGNVTVAVVATRDSGLTSADQTATFTVILFRANADATQFPQELGRATGSSSTITTNRSAFTVTVPTAQATFGPGEILWLEIFATTTTTSATGSTASYYTNSANGIRITAAPQYQTNYRKALADAVAVADSVGRKATSSRALTDSVAIADQVQRVAAHPRSLADALSPIADSLARTFTASRALVDVVPVADALTRRTTTQRSLADGVAVVDAIARRVTYARSLLDALAEGGGSTTVVRRPVFVFDD